MWSSKSKSGYIFHALSIKVTLHNEMNKVGIWRGIYCDRDVTIE